MESWLMALFSLTPYINPFIAQEHINAAIFAQKQTGVPIEILLGIAYVESGYDKFSLSAAQICSPDKKPCGRFVGRWSQKTLPSGIKAPWFCGAMQVGGSVSWDQCKRLMVSLKENYLEGARHLLRWMRAVERRDAVCALFPMQSRERLTCGLWGYNGGLFSVSRKKSSYPTRVLQVVHRILFFRKGYSGLDLMLTPAIAVPF